MATPCVDGINISEKIYQYFNFLIENIFLSKRKNRIFSISKANVYAYSP